MMKQYDVIFFDLDDTLMDFGKTEEVAFYKVFEQYNLLNNLNEYKNSYEEINRGLWRELEQGKVTLSELGSERFRRLFVEQKQDIDPVAFGNDYLKYIGEQVHLIQNAEEVIKKLSCLRLAIITNGFVNVQQSRMENSPFMDCFEHIIVSEQTGYQKPQTGIFDYAFNKLGITDKSNVLMVGDSLTSDIQGGINYGIDTCWFNRNEKENTSLLTPTYEIKDLESLLDIIKVAI